MASLTRFGPKSTCGHKAQSRRVVSTIQCLESNDGIFRQVLDSSNFCAGYLNGTTVCNGDSGGGLHFERNGVWYVGGIISFTAPRDSSNKCQTKSYAGFTNVQKLISRVRFITDLQYLNQYIFVKASKLLPQDCGRTLVNQTYDVSYADLGEFPWIALVLNKNNAGDLFISTHGSLIHKRYVLTRAGFVASVLVRLGEHDRFDKVCQSVNETNCGPPVQDINIESTTVHPEFNNRTLQNSIALIRLAKDVIFTDYIRPVCLPTTKMNNKQYIAAGWGASGKGGEFSKILRKAYVPAIELLECEKKVRQADNTSYYIGEGVICAGTLIFNTCDGDHGTPLGYPFRYPDKNKRFVQYGITSLTMCGVAPSIFTNVEYYMEWILENVKP